MKTSNLEKCIISSLAYHFNGLDTRKIKNRRSLTRVIFLMKNKDLEMHIKKKKWEHDNKSVSVDAKIMVSDNCLVRK